MLPKTHGIFGVIFALILINFFGFSDIAGLVVFLSSVLIDVDHYLQILFSSGEISLRRAYNSHVSKRNAFRTLNSRDKGTYKHKHFVFHGIEFIIILWTLSFLSIVFYWVLLGVVFHLLLDYIDIFLHRGSFMAKFTQVGLWVRNKKG